MSHEPRPNPDGIAAIHLIARALAETDPLGAAKCLSAGLAIQPRGGRVAALAAAVDALAEHDPEIVASLVNRLLVTE